MGRGRPFGIRTRARHCAGNRERHHWHKWPVEEREIQSLEPWHPKQVRVHEKQNCIHCGEIRERVKPSVYQGWRYLDSK